MVKEIYLDNSATTKVLPEVAAAIQEMLASNFGNPSSLHRRGLEAERVIQVARLRLAAACGVREREIFFTSGGTEANNLAVKGAAWRKKRRGKHLVTTKTEHPSVLYSIRALEKEGFEATYLGVDTRGLVDPAEAAAVLREDTILVSVMHVNNETGAVQPVTDIGRLVKEKNPGTLFHVDAVQSLGKLPVCPDEWQADLVTFSAHKIHGPKGVGALFCRAGVELEPLFHGGGQEGGMRPGTENTAGIAGFAEAVRLAMSGMQEKYRHMAELRKALMEGILGRIDGVAVNGPAEGAPHILSVTFKGIKGEVLLHALEEYGIYVSTGSACHSRRPEPSHVLTAMGLDAADVGSTLRFSFSALNTREEVEETIEKLTELAASLRAFKRR